MPAKRTWPGTPAEIRDRDRVLALVARTGERKLRFTVADVREQMSLDPQLALEIPGELSRHIRELPETLVRRVEPRLGIGTTGDGIPARAKHSFVLCHRYREYVAGPPVLDDLERVRFALCVALEATGSISVPTEIVTRVMANIEALAPEQKRLTNSQLKKLSERGTPLARKVELTGERWVRWEAIGERPEHPDFDRWVETFRSMDAQGIALVKGGHATLSEMVRELVQIAVCIHRSSSWPAGRSVTISDIRAAAGRDARANNLLRRLEDRGTSIGKVLGDATKERIGSSRRVDARVVKVANSPRGSTYYDTPVEPGLARRVLVVDYRALESDVSLTKLEALAAEVRGARRVLEAARTPAVRAIAHCRLNAVSNALDAIAARFTHLSDQQALLSERVRESIREREAKFSAFRARWDGREQGCARDAVKTVGLDLDELVSTPRPLITSQEYAAWFPATRARGSRLNLEAPDFLARATTLERFPNPRHTSRYDSEPEAAAITCVDRVDALIYAAELWNARTLVFLRAGALLLGAFHRDPRLPRLALGSSSREERRAALSALVLLGDSEAEAAATSTLHDQTATADDLCNALYALLIMRRVEPAAWPERVRHATDPQVLLARNAVIRAGRENRWLLQP